MTEEAEGSGAARHRRLRCSAATAQRRVLHAVADDPPKGTAHLLRRTSEPVGLVLPPAPRAASCPRFVRARLAARLPELCEALIDLAVAGDLHAAKLLWQMAELDKKPGKPVPGGGRTRAAAGFARKALDEFRAR